MYRLVPTFNVFIEMEKNVNTKDSFISTDCQTIQHGSNLISQNYQLIWSFVDIRCSFTNLLVFI